MEEKESLATILINFGKIWLHPYISRQIRYSFLIIIAQLGTIVFFFSRLPPLIPLFFSQPWGNSQLTPPSALFLLPLFSFVVLLINTFFVASLINKDDFLSKILLFGSTIFSFFSLMAILKVISLAL